MEIEYFQPDTEQMKNTSAVWLESLENPVQAQETLLEGLLDNYNRTEYGRAHGAGEVGSYEEYKKAFPVHSYSDMKPMIDQVIAGRTEALLYEEPFYWMLTKGSTGKSKYFPYLAAHNRQYIEARKRIYYSYALLKNDYDWMTGYRLNLNSSGNLGVLQIGAREYSYGYSLAVTVGLSYKDKGVPNRIIPTQEEMDSIKGESSREVWEAKYELAYQKAKNQHVTHVGTGHNVLFGFAKYLKREHGKYPKDIWDLKLITTGGYPNANTYNAAPLKALYGKSADIRDMYVSTEGVYGGQLDDKKAWSPFYDFTFYEVQTIGGIKPLYEMRPGEIGSLIVSTLYLPRYRLGDLIMAFEPPYFRCIGREDMPMPPYQFSKL